MMNKRITRKQALSTSQQRHVIHLWTNKAFSLRELAALYGVCAMTIYRIVHKSLRSKQELGEPINDRRATSQDESTKVHNSYG